MSSRLRPTVRREVGLVLLGGGGHSRSILDVARRSGRSVIAISDPACAGTVCDGVPILGSDDDLILHARQIGAEVLPALGSLPGVANLLRAHLDAPWGVLIARTATIASDASIGAASVALEHSHVGPGSVVGRGVIVNTSAVVEHDCTIGSVVHLSPGCVLAGGVTIGDGSWVGAGAVVLEGRKVGRGSIVGAGAVVTSDVPDGVVVVGSPARRLGSTPYSVEVSGVG